MIYIANPLPPTRNADDVTLFIEAADMEAANKYAEQKCPGVKFKVREASKPEAALARDMRWVEVAEKK